jgi:quercetin dioxygenase-like cupin family protein
VTRSARRVVAGDDGKTRFEDFEVEFVHIEGVVEGAVFDAYPLGAADSAVVSFEPGFVAPFHNTPGPTWMFVMSGRMALGVSDDQWIELVPGDMIHMLDATGEGHQSRVVGDEPVVMVTAGFGG